MAILFSTILSRIRSKVGQALGNLGEGEAAGSNNSLMRAGTDTARRGLEQHALAAASWLHPVYPGQFSLEEEEEETETTHTQKSFVYWAASEAVLQAYHGCTKNPMEGKCFLVYGGSGSGKTTAVDLLVRGTSRMQPQRSLTIRWTDTAPAPNTDDTAAASAGSGSQELHGLMQLRSDLNLINTINQEQITELTALASALADEVIRAVTENSKQVIKKRQQTLERLTESVSGWGDVVGEGLSTEASKTSDPLSKKGIPIVGLDSKWQKPTTGQQKFLKPSCPVVVLDDFNTRFQSDGVLAVFLARLIQRAISNRVCIFVVTSDRTVGYLLCELGQGSKVKPIDPCRIDLSEIRTLSPDFVKDWTHWMEFENSYALRDNDRDESVVKQESEHLKRRLRKVPNFCLRDFEFSKKELTQLFTTAFPQEDPERIKALLQLVHGEEKTLRDTFDVLWTDAGR